MAATGEKTIGSDSKLSRELAGLFEAKGLMDDYRHAIAFTDRPDKGALPFSRFDVVSGEFGRLGPHTLTVIIQRIEAPLRILKDPLEKEASVSLLVRTLNEALDAQKKNDAERAERARRTEEGLKARGEQDAPVPKSEADAQRAKDAEKQRDVDDAERAHEEQHIDDLRSQLEDEENDWARKREARGDLLEALRLEVPRMVKAFGEDVDSYRKFFAAVSYSLPELDSLLAFERRASLRRLTEWLSQTPSPEFTNKDEYLALAGANPMSEYIFRCSAKRPKKKKFDDSSIDENAKKDEKTPKQPSGEWEGDTKIKGMKKGWKPGERYRDA